MIGRAQSGSLLALLCVVFACGESSTGGGTQAAGGSAGTTAGGSGGTTAGAGGDGSGQAGTSGGQAGQGGGGGATAGSGGAGGAAAGSGGAVAGDGGGAGAAGAGGAEGVGCSGAALCWDFEEGAIPQGWQMIRPMDFTGTIGVDNSRPHGGSYSLHMAGLQGGTVGEAGGPKKSMQYTLPANFGPVMWGRAFVYTTPERPESHAGFFNARYPSPTSQDTSWEALDWYEVASYQQNYMSIWHPPEPPGFPEWVKVSDTPLTIDAWSCVEWYFDAANGAEANPADPRVWLDGTELGWPTEFTFDDSGTDKPTRPPMEKGENFTMIETGAYFYQGVTVPTDYWIDDLAIGPERIGCQ